MPLSAIDVALIHNASEGNLDEVRRLLLAGANVNAQRDADGATALMAASYQGHVEVVRELLQHDQLDVNARANYGGTALYMASSRGHVEVVGELLQNNEVDVNLKRKDGATALHAATAHETPEIIRLLLQDNNLDVNARRNDGRTALYLASYQGHVEVVLELLQHDKLDVNAKDVDDKTALHAAWRHDNILEFLRKYAKAEEDNRTLLRTLITTRKRDPVELSYKYIKRCMTKRNLGSGAFGDVFLAEDSNLPELKQFAVKMIKLSPGSYDPNDKRLKSFQKELSTLKRLHHPNILDLYGYNFKGSAGEQFLVYEYAANGSLDGFLKDDVMRARLPAAMRLSIMYQVARAVHYLHTGAAGWKIYHRDIRSANICLTKDLTPKLIGCGLAKFVEDELNAFPSEPTKQASSSEGPAIGTIGYMCPEYASKKTHQIKCDYIPAYDVYSFGVVMAELILGRLNDGKPTNVLQTYVLNDQTAIVDGWKQLKHDADGQADWNADALEVVCLTAIGCITPSSEGRLSTIDLLDLLNHAINKHGEKSDVEPVGELLDPPSKKGPKTDNVRAMLDAILFKIGKGNS